MVIDVDKELESLKGVKWGEAQEEMFDFESWGNTPKTCEWMITRGYCCLDFPEERADSCECWDNDRIRQVILLRRARFNYGYRKR